MPSIKSLFLPCEGDRPLFEARLGKLQIVLYQMEKVAKVQILIGSAWFRVLGQARFSANSQPEFKKADVG